MKKRLLTMLLAVLLVASMALPAMAVEMTEPGEEGRTTLTYMVSSTYTVTIPVSQEFSSTQAKTGTVALESGALIPFGNTLTVTISSPNFIGTTYRMKDGVKDNYLVYQIEKGLDQAKTTITTDGATVLTVAATSAKNGASETLTFTPSTPTIAGEYTDTLTFAVAVATPD